MRVDTGIVVALLMSMSIAAVRAASEIAPLRVGDALPNLEGEFLTGRPASSGGCITVKFDAAQAEELKSVLVSQRTGQ